MDNRVNNVALRHDDIRRTGQCNEDNTRHGVFAPVNKGEAHIAHTVSCDKAGAKAHQNEHARHFRQIPMQSKDSYHGENENDNGIDSRNFLTF